jgi:hypothetical protein
MGNAHLFITGKRHPRCLLTIPEGGVKNGYSILLAIMIAKEGDLPQLLRLSWLRIVSETCFSYMCDADIMVVASL